MTTGQQDSYADEQERQKQLAAWKARKKHEAEEAERQRKRAALEGQLAERARIYFDHTGTTPSASLLESWQQQYIDAKVAEQEAEREARRREAIEEHYDFTRTLRIEEASDGS